MAADFHFLRPWWLLLFLPLLAFLFWYARRRFEMRRWRDIIDPRLMPHVLIGTDYRTRRRISAILALAGALMIAALAGPAWQQLSQPVFRSQDALVIALDLSRSMDVADVKPTRLARARFKISDILERRDEGQTALIAYAAQPYVISPLTDDTQTIIAQLPALTTDLMPSQGSRADRALGKAAELLRQSGAGEGRILLVTDGADAGKIVPLAQKLHQQGIRISALGVGTDEGGPIPGPGGFVKRGDGSIVIVKLDAVSLESIAAEGGGRFSKMVANESDIERLLADRTERPVEIEDTGLEVDVWREEGPWLLLPLLPLAALAFRRGVLAAWMFALLPLLILLPVKPAEAFEWTDLWRRPDQRATRLLEQGDPAGAAGLFDDPAWKGAANYRAGRYEDSLAALDGLDDPESLYNRGNALAKLGRYDEAIVAWEDVLERDPGHRDANYNRDLLFEQMQQNQQQNDSAESDSSGDASEHAQDESAGEQPADNPDAGENNNAQENGSANPGADAGQQRGDASRADAGQPPGEAGAPPESVVESQTGTDERQAEMQTGEDGRADDARTARTAPDAQPLDEDVQATEQWLRKIPDDPGGLLRRKFYYQYQQRDARQTEKEPW